MINLQCFDLNERMTLELGGNGIASFDWHHNTLMNMNDKFENVYSKTISFNKCDGQI